MFQESTYWLLAVAVVMSMSYVSVEGTPGSNCTGNAKSCADNETCSDPTCVTRGSCTWGNLGDKGVCDNTTGKCACTTGYSWEAEKCKANGYNHTCSNENDCQSGNLGDKGVCDNTTKMCDCNDSYSWKGDNCTANGYNDACNTTPDCQLGSLGENGTCNIATKMCHCKDGFFWEVDMCKANELCQHLFVILCFNLRQLRNNETRAPV
ncbi:hypothetical protein MAR_030586, partial [Mya arenaria]